MCSNCLAASALEVSAKSIVMTDIHEFWLYVHKYPKLRGNTLLPEHPTYPGSLPSLLFRFLSVALVLSPSLSLSLSPPHRLHLRALTTRPAAAAVPGNSQRVLNVLHNTEEPASVFAILEGGAKQPVLVADTLLDALLPKMAVLYTSNKKQTRIESKGNRYEMGDFVVKLGSVTMSGSFKGILVEVRTDVWCEGSGLT